jgi:hypothetical protein
MLVYPRGGCKNTACHLFAHLLICWVSPKQVWIQPFVAQEASCFLSVTWHGEALYGLGVQGIEARIYFGAFFLPSVAPAKFLIYRTHAVCFYILFATLDPLG